LPANDWANDNIFTFAVQALSAAVGSAQVLDYVVSHSDRVDAEEDAGEGAAQLLLPEAEEVDNDDHNDESAITDDDKDHNIQQVREEVDQSLLEQEQEQEEDASFSVFNSMNGDHFDNGACFHGDFSQCFLSTSSLADNFHKASHLFNQLCLAEYKLLPVYFEIYAALASASTTAVVSDDTTAVTAVSAVSGKLPHSHSCLSRLTATLSFVFCFVTFVIVNLVVVVVSIVHSSLKGTIPVVSPSALHALIVKDVLKPTIPAVLRAHRDADLLALFTHCRSSGGGVTDAHTRSLLSELLALLQSDFSQPAKPQVIETVYHLVTAAGTHKSTTMTSGTTTLAALASLPLASLPSDEDFKLFAPLISGLSNSVIELSLPRFIRLFADDMDSLEIIFGRILRARPPPMTKAGLLIALHR
jgi:hypothetical protein